ncbi:FAD binding domain-containing protein [Bradyrhizobium sp. Ash2021]|uniref:FAD binding domain-containing protein n=1 Tax=Bradyrhizobium sp. Ash2021 TaxID=2954771 RepID=UPI0028167390|nr:FAD binding domain-containing protein [Bradyrhizobium sp. Ash2021]WMT76443.1 FAD binding domain-containing protein [Bradyrhizobium sp. Ash2021]
MHEFEYHRPKTLAEASALLQQEADGKLLAGGQTLIPTLRQRLASPSALIDLAGLPELTGIERTGQVISIGAMTRYAAIVESPLVRTVLPSIARMVAMIGDPLVRNRGTIGGSLANNDPTADLPAAALALDARMITDRRSIDAHDFFVDLFTTALLPGEILTRIDFPMPRRAAYIKFRNPASRYAVVGVFVSEGPAGIAVAVTGAGPKVFRQKAFEAALAREFSPASLVGITVDSDGLNSDLHASADYRANLVSVLARRAVAAAISA